MKAQLIALDLLVSDRNIRSTENEQAGDLIPSLLASGLKTPLDVLKPATEGAPFSILRGNRRYNAIQTILATEAYADNKHAQTWLKSGIPCRIHELTEAEVPEFIADHDDTRALSAEELLLSAIEGYRALPDSILEEDAQLLLIKRHLNSYLITSKLAGPDATALNANVGTATAPASTPTAIENAKNARKAALTATRGWFQKVQRWASTDTAYSLIRYLVTGKANDKAKIDAILGIETPRLSTARLGKIESSTVEHVKKLRVKTDKGFGFGTCTDEEHRLALAAVLPTLANPTRPTEWLTPAEMKATIDKHAGAVTTAVEAFRAEPTEANRAALKRASQWASFETVADITVGEALASLKPAATISLFDFMALVKAADRKDKTTF